MKKGILYIIVCLLLSAAVVYAGTISGVHKENGSVARGSHVAVYSFGTAGNYAIGNATLVGTDTTDANGEWSVTTTLTTQHLVIIKDVSDDAKKAVSVFATPE